MLLFGMRFLMCLLTHRPGAYCTSQSIISMLSSGGSLPSTSQNVCQNIPNNSAYWKVHTEIYNPVCKQSFWFVHEFNTRSQSTANWFTNWFTNRTQITYKLGAEAILSDRAVPVRSVSVTSRTLGNQWFLHEMSRAAFSQLTLETSVFLVFIWVHNAQMSCCLVNCPRAILPRLRSSLSYA